jgi:hypothetical protein
VFVERKESRRSIPARRCAPVPTVNGPAIEPEPPSVPALTVTALLALGEPRRSREAFRR